MTLPKLTNANLTGKRVIVRADLDIDPTDLNNLRLTSLIPTLDYLKSQNCTITIISHRGRPEGKADESLSLRDFQPYFAKWNARVLENLRFHPGEESNDPEFAKMLAVNQDFYVNESFATSHRKHASIVGLPKLLPHAAGLRFTSEVENLSRVFENPARPSIVIISGIKEDKVAMIKAIKDKVDEVLVAGRLPDYLGEDYKDEKVIVAKLNPDKEDITINSIEIFEKEILKAGTIVLAGVPGKYEEEGHKLGTERVFKAVANSRGFKIVGGGDSLVVVQNYNLTANFNWISVGGGAMLEFLSYTTLPGIDALLIN
jgi:phosphoglycerate kinase